MSIEIKDVEAKVLDLAAVILGNYEDIARKFLNEKGEKSIKCIEEIIDELRSVNNDNKN